LHHPNFTVDERCIQVGLKVMAELATTRSAVGDRPLPGV
jgi:metal-dependent amidase/aminoacylase/carboxypeptidase family protein